MKAALPKLHLQYGLYFKATAAYKAFFCLYSGFTPDYQVGWKSNGVQRIIKLIRLIHLPLYWSQMKYILIVASFYSEAIKRVCPNAC